jgi:alkanesulfonate monooxygenase SsuD/methylene tetrahydromethanopterin reductase-like flavin-dependent oxidoreductase (luciferase family)
MKFNIILEANNSPERVAELARLAESYGMAGIWVSNMHDSRDPFINFVEAARTTKNIKLGPVAVSPYELHPLKMANALLTLNEISAGRAQIGVGAGDGGTATAMGMKAVRRVRATRECVEIIEAAATGEPVTYKGEMYEVMYYHSSWVTQPRPDIFVCAGGPQMIRSSAKYAQGIYVGDHLPEHVAAVTRTISDVHQEIGRVDKNFRLLNFWAWHVKENQDDARAEAAIWLAMRATPWPQFYHKGILPDEEMQIVWDNLKEINMAYYKRDHKLIKNVPKDILDRLVDQCASTSSIDNLDHEIDRLRRFEAAGLTDICLRIYENPEDSIRLIGERVMPAFS